MCFCSANNNKFLSDAVDCLNYFSRERKIGLRTRFVMVFLRFPCKMLWSWSLVKFEIRILLDVDKTQFQAQFLLLENSSRWFLDGEERCCGEWKTSHQHNFQLQTRSLAHVLKVCCSAAPTLNFQERCL